MKDPRERIRRLHAVSQEPAAKDAAPKDGVKTLRAEPRAKAARKLAFKVPSLGKLPFVGWWKSLTARLAARPAKGRDKAAAPAAENSGAAPRAAGKRVGGQTVRQRAAGAWRRVAGPLPLSQVRDRVRAWADGLGRTPVAATAANDDGARSLHGALSQWRRLGWGVITVFLGGFVVWASFTRPDSAVIAHGVVGVESNRKTVQHLEGGIVKDILVAEGERVVAGQPLVRFDDTKARATLDLLRGQRVAALALKARLEAERDGKREIDFPRS
ncbi:MAG: hypothetical protein H6906_10330 [Hyphomicrobiales bacterium]|nr:hypothetical protein [Hyphomicrobiales bacterium]